MTSISIDIILLFVIAFFANIVYGLTSFGAAIVFQCCWQIAELVGVASGGVNEGTKHIAVLMFVTRGIQAVNLRSHCVQRLAISMMLVCVPALVLGTLLAYSLPQKTTQVIVGIIFLLILSFNISSKGVRLPPPLKLGNEASIFGGDRSHLYALMLASFASGSLMGICGSTEANPYMVLLTSFASVEPVSWRSTAAVVEWCVGAIQLLLLYFMIGQKFGSVDMIANGFMIFGGVLGLWMGNLLSPRVNAELFGKTLVVFLAMAATSMITVLASVTVQLVGLMVSAIIALAVVLFHSYTDSRRAEEARARADAFSMIPQVEPDAQLMGEEDDDVPYNIKSTHPLHSHSIELTSVSEEAGVEGSSPAEGATQSTIERQSLLEAI